MAIHRLSASAPYLHARVIAAGKQAQVVTLIDTGASISTIRQRFVDELRLPEFGMIDMGRVGEESRVVPTYYLELMPDPDSRSFVVEVVVAEPGSPCDMLIGRDLLSRWVLSWDGPGDRLILSY